MSTTQDGGRRQTMSYFRYASLVTGELAAETAPVIVPAAGDAVGGGAVAGEAAVSGAAATEAAADAAGLTTALWRAAHVLSPAAAATGRSAASAPGPYTASVAREAAPPTGGAGQLDRRG